MDAGSLAARSPLGGKGVGVRERVRFAGSAMLLSGRPERLRLVQGAMVVVLGAVTLALVVDHRLVFAVGRPSLDLALDTSSAIVALAVAIVGFVRAREALDAPALYDGAAFLLLAVANTAHIGLAVAGLDSGAGLDPASATVAPLYAAGLVRDGSALLLLAGALPVLRSRRYSPRQRIAVLVLPTVVVGALCLAVAATASERIAPAELAAMTGERVAGTALQLPGGAPTVALNLVAVVLLATAAIVRPTVAGGVVPPIWLAGALTIATFGALHSLLGPAPYAGIVTTADVMQLAFYGTLFTALQATRGSELRHAREADDRRRRYHQADVAAAATSERLRLARELHDGVVQDLLAVRHDLDAATAGTRTAGNEPAADTPMRRAAQGLETAISDARRTIDQLRSGATGSTCLAEELAARPRAFSERYGHTIDLRVDPALATVCGARATEVLRIVDEVLANVHRHADATTVRIAATRAGDELILTVVDNGRGFVAEHTQPGQGIIGMLERAELLGGRLTIQSAIGEGTQVRLFAPLTSDHDD